jgi:hypothetical protein
MDLSNANTEAFIQFHRFHEHLNRTIKTLVIGLGLTAESVQRGRSAESINQLLRDQGWLWGGMPDWTAPGELIDEARRDIGRTGVIRAFSAFDFFLDGIDADLASWGHRSLDWSPKLAAGPKPRPRLRMTNPMPLTGSWAFTSDWMPLVRTSSFCGRFTDISDSPEIASSIDAA